MDKVIYAFWTGANQMSPSRAACLDTLINYSKCDVVLVTPDNLKKFVVPSSPLHSSYEHLSLTHKSDYLRCYFMHHHGGGYSDIKETVSSWAPAFDDLTKSSAYVNGYPELSPDCVAMVGGELYAELRKNYRKVVGCSAFMCKPKTPFTLDWINEVHRRLDYYEPYLSKAPSVHPQEKRGMVIEGKLSEYPLLWTEILGNIFHPLCLKYSDRILQSLPPCDFSRPYR